MEYFSKEFLAALRANMALSPSTVRYMNNPVLWHLDQIEAGTHPNVKRKDGTLWISS
jgi:hypothetical protein